MSSSDTAAEDPVPEGQADKLAEAARQLAESPGDADKITQLAEHLFRHYCARVAEGEATRLIRGTQNISATETLMVASHLLREAKIEVFELALWQQWNRGG